jgi:hypothetical protein
MQREQELPNLLGVGRPTGDMSRRQVMELMPGLVIDPEAELKALHKEIKAAAFKMRASHLDRSETRSKDDETGGEKAAKRARMDLIDPEFEWKMAEVMGFGLIKYSKDNWKGVRDTGLMLGAAKRHINLHMMNETEDPDSGLPHLAHAAITIMMAWWIREYGDEQV